MVGLADFALVDGSQDGKRELIGFVIYGLEEKTGYKGGLTKLKWSVY